MSNITYTPIAATTIGSDTATVVFSNIPAAYKHLVLTVREVATNTGSNECVVRFNNDANSNYSYNWFYGNGSSVTTTRNNASTGALISGEVASRLATVDVFSYSSSNIHKTALSTFEGLASGNKMIGHITNCWSNTDAIHTITFDTRGSQYSYLWRAGTKFAIYGIGA